MTTRHVPGIAFDTDHGWRSAATCRHADPDLFFPKPGDYATAAEAVAVCESCPVIDACLHDALNSRERHGIRGGLTPVERRKVAMQRRTTRHAHTGAGTHSGQPQGPEAVTEPRTRSRGSSR